MDDISDIAPLAKSTPQDAAKNISNANLFGMPATDYVRNTETKDALDQKATIFDKPQKAEPPVADYMRQSSEHASLAAPDVDHLNYMTRQMKLIGDYVFDRPTTDHEIVQLNLKKMQNGGKLDVDDDIRLLGLNQEQKDAANRDYGISGPIEKLPAQIAGTISDIGQSIVRGVRQNIFNGPFMNSKHPVSGLLMNASYGAFVKDPYDTLTGSTYNELSSLTDQKGQPKNLDHETKASISRAVGVIGTTLMNGAGFAVAEATPFLKPFINPTLVRQVVENPTRAAIMVSIGDALKAATATGGAAGFTEVAKIIGEEVGKNHGTDEAGFLNSLQTAANKAKEYAPRVAGATAIGALTGLGLEAPAMMAGFGLTRQRFQNASEAANMYMARNARDVTPEALKALPGQTPPGEPVVDLTPNGGGTGGQPHVDQSVKMLQLNEALHNINDVQRSTEMGKLAPGELSELNKKGFFGAGINKFYTTFEALKNFATDEKKGVAARNLIDPSGVAAGQMNAPLEVEPHKFMEVAKEYPDILDHIQIHPDGPNAIQAKEHLEELNAAHEQRQEVMAKLGIKPQEVQPASNVVPMPEKAKVEKVPYNLEADVRRTQEILDAKKAFEALDAPAPKDEKTLAKLDKELVDIKGRVTAHLQEAPFADVLPFPFNGETVATKAEREYGRGPTFTDAIASVLPKDVVEKYNAAQLRARVNVVDQVHDAAVHEMNQVTDQVTAMAKEEMKRAEIDRIAHDPNFAVVDKFRSNITTDPSGKNKRSIYSIDPKSLPNDMLHYLDNPRLKEHKVFQKDGLSVDKSAAELGFENGSQLLDVLSKTPTRKQILKARSAFYESHINEMVKQGVDLDHTNIIKAFTDRTAAHVQEMKFMREQEWPQAKSGIKKIALPLPRIEELIFKAQDAVKNMPVGSLNPVQFAVGERRSQKIAVNSILKNEVEKAFMAKENAALNSEMQKAVRIAIAKVNRVQKFVRRLNDPAAQQIFIDAGKASQAARDELLDVFNFNPKQKHQAELGSFQKWMKRELEAGRGNFSIPERLSDIRQSIDEMTVEQVLIAGDRLRAVFHEAKFKAELLKNVDERDEQRSVDHVAQTIHEAAVQHPAYDETRIPSVQETKNFNEHLRLFLSNAESLFTNMEHVLREYDQGKLGGYFQELFQHPLKGDGKYNKVSGYTKELNMTQIFAKHMHELMDAHGDFNDLDRKILNVPEFKDITQLNNGRLTKADLMVFWANKGDPAGREKLSNNHGGVSLETWQKVFDRELEVRDVTLMQRAVDMFKAYQDETQKLQVETTGQDVTFIKGVPNEHQGKFYPGGYVPQKYRHDYTKAAAKQTIDFLKGRRAAWFEKDDGEAYGRQFAAEQTEQGRLIERTDSSKPLDSSLLRFFRGHEEIIHDLSYRKAVMNALKVLRDDRISKDLISMAGEPKYNLVVNTVIELAGRAEAMNANYFSDQNRTLKALFGHLQNNFNVTVLGMNMTSTAVQYESLTQLFQNTGAAGLKHFADINAQMMSHPHLWGGFYDFAVDLDPTIGHFLEGLQNKISSVVHDLVPRKSVMPAMAPLKAAHQFTVNAMMAPMSIADIHLKIMGAMTGYRQFMAGHVENWPIEKVMALSDEERYAQAQAYVRQLSRLSLTHARPEDKAPSQKNPLTNFFSNYWNDLRNVLNNELSQGRKARWKSKETFDKYKEGDYTGAFRAGATAAGVVMTTVITSTLGRIYSDYLRGIQKTPLDWKVDLRSKEGIADASEKMGYYMMMSPADQLFSVAPFAKDVFFAANMPDKKIGFGAVDKTKTVSLPITKTLSDIATAGNSIGDIVSDAHSLSDVLFLAKNLDKKETRAILNSISYLLLPMPVNAYSKLTKWIDNHPNSSTKMIGALDKLKDNVAGFIKNPPENTSQEFIDALKDINKEIATKVVSIPEGTTDAFKHAMSGADWSKPNGIYGIRPDQWKEIQKQAPELGLTDGGRIAQNTEQQEKAMDWLLHSNAEKLGSENIPVNQNTLFGSFRLGVDAYEKLYKEPANSKLKGILNADVLAKNPDLANFKTVGQVKLYLMNALNHGKKSNQKTAELTLPTPNAED